MSGICGIANFDGAPVEPEVLENMAQAAAHRGPDGIHYYKEGSIGFAYLALNITPESVRERQPLQSREGDLLLTADARIDNREELIRTLRAKKHLREDAPTDADLILGAYRCWGEECPARLIGDFAFAVWDARRKRLFAARDAMGMRALYYRVEPRRVVFGTEVKQILAAPGVPARIFEPAVGAYLAGCFGPLEWSFYEGISQLAPAHALVVDRGGVRSWRYWDIDPDYRIEYATEEEYVEHFFEVFRESVRCRLRSVKPVGIFLSGGMDSGSIASTAGWLLQRGGGGIPPVFRAYCWAFNEFPQCDERHISDLITQHYNFPVTEVAVDEAWPLKDYPEHGPDQDEPLISGYQVVTEHALAAARSEGMGSVLTGDRGDLMVGAGIVDHLGLLRAGYLQTLWGELWAHSRWHETSMSRAMTGQLLKPFLYTLWPRGAKWALSTRQKLQGVEQPPYPGWIQPEFAERVGLTQIIEENEEPQPNMNDYARRRRYERVFMFLQMRVMTMLERTRAKYGLGFAEPWSDRRLASFVLAIPQWRIQQVCESKRIARRAMRGVMPEEVRRKTAKILPTPVYEHAIRERSQDTITNLITDSGAVERGYLDESVLQDYYQLIRGGKPIHPSFWWALTLEMWLRQHWS